MAMDDDFPVAIVSLEDIMRGSANRRNQGLEERDRTQIEMLERRTETAERKVDILKKLLREVLGMLDLEMHAAVVQLIDATLKELRPKSTANAEIRKDTVDAQS
jgi:predicted RNase H-like nuclease (RuvC/YqgF family)